MNIQITYPGDRTKILVSSHSQCSGLVRLPSSFGDGKMTLFYRERGKDKWVEMGATGMLTTITNPVPVSSQDETFLVAFMATRFAKVFEVYVRCENDGDMAIDSNVVAVEVVKNFQEMT